MKPNRYAAAFFAFATLAVAGPLAAQTSPGVTFDVTMTTRDSAGGSGPAETAKGWMTRDRARMDMSTGPMPGVSNRSTAMTILVDRTAAGGREVTMLNHDEKQIIRPDRMMAQMNEMMRALPMRPQMSLNVDRFVVDTLGAGATIEGFATQRYRVRMDLTMRVIVMADTQTMTMSADQTGDFIPEFADFVNAMQDVGPMRSMMDMIGASPEMQESFNRMIAQSPKGLQASGEMTMSISSPMIGSHGVTQSVRLSSIRRADIPASVFAIPEGYTELQIPAPGGGR